jgi:hypothetical protein
MPNNLSKINQKEQHSQPERDCKEIVGIELANENAVSSARVLECLGRVESLELVDEMNIESHLDQNDLNAFFQKTREFQSEGDFSLVDNIVKYDNQEFSRLSELISYMWNIDSE